MRGKEKGAEFQAGREAHDLEHDCPLKYLTVCHVVGTGHVAFAASCSDLGAKGNTGCF